MQYVKIAFVGSRGIFSNYGGVENATREIVLEMSQEKNVKINVCSVHSENDNKFVLPENVKITFVPSFIYKYFGQHGYILFCILNVLLIDRPKVVILFASGPCVFTPLLRFGGIKVITSLRAFDSARDKWGKVSRTILQFGEYCSWRFANEFTANSKEMISFFSKYRHDAHFIPNGAKQIVNININELETYGLKSNHYLLFAARLDPVKRLHLLLEANKRLPDSIRLPLVIAGGNVKDKAYEKMLRKHESQSVIFLGHIQSTQLETLMKHSRAFILPSVLEGMSNSLLSAMVNSKAVLAADIVENSDVVEYKDALFEKDNVDDLYEKLIKISTDIHFCNSLGQKLGAIASEKYSWSATSAMFLKLIMNHV